MLQVNDTHSDTEERWVRAYTCTPKQKKKSKHFWNSILHSSSFCTRKVDDGNGNNDVNGSMCVLIHLPSSMSDEHRIRCITRCTNNIHFTPNAKETRIKRKTEDEWHMDPIQLFHPLSFQIDVCKQNVCSIIFHKRRASIINCVDLASLFFFFQNLVRKIKARRRATHQGMAEGERKTHRTIQI